MTEPSNSTPETLEDTHTPDSGQAILSQWISRCEQHRSQIFLVVFALISVVSAGLAFGLDRKTIKGLFEHSRSYYFLFLTVLVWAMTLIPDWKSWPLFPRWVRKHIGVLLIALVITVCSFLNSPPKFRVLADETNLIGIAQAMYEDQNFYNLTSAYYIYETKSNKSHVYGKRPLLYPFMISVAHTLTGYSGYNGMVVNGVSGFLCLIAFFFLLRVWFQPAIALTGMVLLAAFPVYTLWVTSSGFEIPNLMMAIFTFYLLGNFLQHRDADSAEKLALTLVLVAQVRYESILIPAVLLPLLVLFLPVSQYARLSWRSLLIPLMFVPIVWHRVLNLGSSFQLDRNTEPFALKWLFENLAHAADFFAGVDQKYGTIPYFYLLTLVGLIWWVTEFVHKQHYRKVREGGMALGVVGTTLAIVGVLFAYYWGDLTKQYSIRLGIIFLPVFIVPALFLLEKLLNLKLVSVRNLVVASIALLIFMSPQAFKNDSVREILLYRKYSQTLDFLEREFPNRDILLITDRPGMYSPHRFSSVNFVHARSNRHSILSQMRNRLFRDVIVIQEIRYATRKPENELDFQSGTSWEVLYEIQTNNKYFIRLSRLVIP